MTDLKRYGHVGSDRRRFGGSGCGLNFDLPGLTVSEPDDVARQGLSQAMLRLLPEREPAPAGNNDE
ncbi:hypothetical protein [Nocardia elegans]|uniref:hypothetical protein n=1 Tax=Nocardia elegans TaxID=300029 RepID=UPI001E5B7987|nr:hypothetical protein [Nocardia elegans]